MSSTENLNDKIKKVEKLLKEPFNVNSIYKKEIEKQYCECGQDVTNDKGSRIDENGNWACSECLIEMKKLYEKNVNACSYCDGEIGAHTHGCPAE